MGQIRDGRKTIFFVGSRDRLVATSTPARWVQIEALPTNGGANAAQAEVVIGGSSAVQAAGNRRGCVVKPGEPGAAKEDRGLFIRGPLNLVDVWMDVGYAMNGVSFMYEEA